MSTKKNSKSEYNAHVDYIASKVNKRASKGKSIIQFTFTVVITPGGSFTFKNCIAGMGKNGPWVTPSIQKYRSTQWDMEFSNTIIAEFTRQGEFDDIVPAWEEPEGREIRWQK